jgi:hypothetical protein
MFLLLESAFNQDRDKAEIFAKAIEGSIRAIDEKADEKTAENKQFIKAELYNALRNVLATKEFVRAENNELRTEIKQNALLLKMLIGSVSLLHIYHYLAAFDFKPDRIKGR